jgi:hypothetical protein
MYRLLLMAVLGSLAVAGCVDDSSYSGAAHEPNGDTPLGGNNGANTGDEPGAVERCDGPLRIDAVEAYGPAGGGDGPELLSVRVAGNLCGVALAEHQGAVQLRGTGGSSQFGISDRCQRRDQFVDADTGAFVYRWVIGYCGSGADVEQVQIYAIAAGAIPEDFPLAASAEVGPYAAGAPGGACNQFAGQVCSEGEICGPDVVCAPPSPPTLRDVAVWMNPTTGDTHVDLEMDDANGDATGSVEVVYWDEEGQQLGAAVLGPGGWATAPFDHTVRISASARGAGLPQVGAPHSVAEVTVTAIDLRELRSEPMTAVPMASRRLRDGEACDEQFNAVEACGPDSVCGGWTCLPIPDSCDSLAWRTPDQPAPGEVAGAGPGGEAEAYRVALPPGAYTLSVDAPDTPFTVMLRRHCEHSSLDSQLLWGLTVSELRADFRVTEDRPLWLLIDSRGPFAFAIRPKAD